MGIEARIGNIESALQIQQEYTFDKYGNKRYQPSHHSARLDRIERRLNDLEHAIKVMEHKMQLINLNLG